MDKHCEQNDQECSEIRAFRTVKKNIEGLDIELFRKLFFDGLDKIKKMVREKPLILSKFLNLNFGFSTKYISTEYSNLDVLKTKILTLGDMSYSRIRIKYQNFNEVMATIFAL